MTPSKKKVVAKVPGLRDVKEVKDVKMNKMPKPTAPKPAQPLPFKGMTKLAQYSYNKSSSNRMVEMKPLKVPGVSKFIAELSSSKQ